jgi:hypothetical protein
MDSSTAAYQLLMNGDLDKVITKELKKYDPYKLYESPLA